MSTIETGFGTILLLCAAALAVGCTPDATRSGDVGSKEGTPAVAVAEPGAPADPGEIIAPREGTKLEPAAYTVTESAYRLFGTESDEQGRAAVIASVRDWQTRTYHEGDLLGRGLRIASIEEGKVTLQGAKGDVVLEPGVDVSLRIVRHRLDVVARPLGRHHYALDPVAAKAAKLTLPTFETHELFGGPVLKLGPIEPGSLFAETGFREGDLVAAVDGAPAGTGSLEDITRALTDGRTSVVVRVYRGGVPMERTFTVR